MKTHGLAFLAATALLGASACQMTTSTTSVATEAGIGHAQMVKADDQPGQWASYSRTWDEQRYSPLDQINDSNAHRLGLAWFDDLDTYRGVQATPLVIDGVLYNENIFNVVTAYNAKTGEKLWVYDPKVGKEWAGLACCGPSSRGLAAWGNKIIIGALDGRLIAIDRKTGAELWSAQTFDRKEQYSITGAPRVYDGKVIIGNGGADYGSRGFVAAYDAETGKRLWKFYIVPGNPANGPDGEASDSAMKIAAPTWHGKFWKTGGGGNAWDSFAYDPELNLVYIGTGNGSPQSWHHRSDSKGDNLFLCSMVAVDATTGAYKWHYQMVPEEDWDYTCTQPIVLADLKIDGKLRKVAMQAPKNGFFYVLDRATGALISAKSYVSVNTWASHVDMKTGRPVVLPTAHNTTTPHIMSPSWMAAHTWHPMSYSPKTGLVYLSAQEQGSIYANQPDGAYQYVRGRNNTGFDHANQPDLRKQLMNEIMASEKGYLLAWNPATQSEAWRVPYPHPGSGGVLTTAGNILVQPTINKTVAIYRADNGRKLWEMNVDQAGVAGAMTYMIDGEQYIALNVGWGGSPVYNLAKDGPFRFATAKLLVFKLDAKGVTLPPMKTQEETAYLPRQRIPTEVAARGAALYGETCNRCHGDNAVGGIKDLRRMSKDAHDGFLDIVLNGTLLHKGMPNFSGVLTKAQAEDIHGYLITRAQEDW
ncbi:MULTISPECIES: PQQ-dependent dehydrogenase, methanol/ethanol family [unclassified Sphingobium]|uniref:PQQ-dependent dehydrogenase, methanol/ethanol family n=1 Tax=unclassified Sphingobium TaxID=2611147 RepID=UPI0022240B77|nr:MULTISPECIES: PQQ-dependent dehydrogenase, methanol/ethanol family [unclassified Sphingobium]MCW2411468.1 quinohemoprotein ethanol dehydrogenase [Sphingobium sp. B8D3D]MCW2416239.1 quinohemoprotein ethanol dehydrogenase [Sphingobium sp. B8D3A]